MDKFVPYEKLSKKKKKEQNDKKRVMWNLNPVTRKSKIQRHTTEMPKRDIC